MNTPRPVIDWFEIPVRDLDRAQRFYETGAGHHVAARAGRPGHHAGSHLAR